MAGVTDESFWEDMDTRYSDPDTPWSGRATAPGFDPADLVTSMFESREQAEEYVRTGRPPLGGRKRTGESHTLRGRVADDEYADVMALASATGRSTSELVREGIRRVLDDARARKLIPA